MTVADRYEGEETGICGCGSRLVWSRDSDGAGWHVTHADPEQALVCSAEDSPSDVDEEPAQA